MTKEYVCPNCGSHNLLICTCTSAYFSINEDGSIGPVSLCQNSIDCMNECASYAVEDIEFRCQNCHSNFFAKYGEQDGTYEIGEEL